MTDVTGRASRAALRRTRAVAALLGALVICGSLVTSAGASPAASRAQAKKLLLTLHDMPKGWKTEKGTGSSSPNSFPGADQLASCIGVPASLVNSNPPQAVSPYFENKSGLLEVQDTVSVFPSPSAAKANFNALNNAKTPGCMTTLMNGSLKSQILGAAGKGATLGTITVTKASLSGFPAGSTGIVMALPITDQGVSINATLTAVYYLKGKLGQEVDFNSYGPAFPVSLAKSLTSTALRRL
jgi:hypothetical protein